MFIKFALFATWAVSLVALFATMRGIFRDGLLGMDAHAYWKAGQSGTVYNLAPGQLDAFLYSPAFLIVIEPLAMLPWEFFLTTWVCMQAAVLAWLVYPLEKMWAVPFFLLCTPELALGNIHILLAGAAVLGMRNSAAWAFPILTKVTTGVGLIWFLARGDWRQLAQGLGVLSLAIFISYLIKPDLWPAWFQFLTDHNKGTPDSSMSFTLRCLVAIGLVIVAARKGWAWLVPPAMVFASPILVSYVTLTVMVAIPRLLTPSEAPWEKSKPNL